jgi:hypothetical protein
MLGYSYNEIAAAEDVSYRIVNRQVARAMRLLRQLDKDYGAQKRLERCDLIGAAAGGMTAPRLLGWPGA